MSNIFKIANKITSALFLVIGGLFLFSCLTKQTTISKLESLENYNFNKFTDDYKDNIYINRSIGLTLQFDSNWDIKTKYEDFENLTKKYAQIIVSKTGEVLFVGFNKEKQMGVRGICEIRDLSTDEYIKKLKVSISQDISDYKVNFILEKRESLEYVEGIHIVAEATINKANKFIFDSFVFKKGKINIKIDFWCHSLIYKQEEKYIKNIFNSINILPDISNDTMINDTTTDSL